MSVEAVKEYLKPFGLSDQVLELAESSATVELAAHALGTQPARIAKTLSFLVGEEAILIVAAGDAKIDNAKYKAQFHQKAKMLTPQQVLELVGHPVGGVCPSGRAWPSTWTKASSVSRRCSPPAAAAIPPSS